MLPIALLMLLSKSLTYIKTNNSSPLEPSRTPYRIILIIPGLVAIASKHCNLTAPYYGCIYILNLLVTCNDHTLFHFSYGHAVYLLFDTDVVFPAQHSYVSSSDQLFYRCFFRLVYRFWCKAPHLRLQL